MSTLARFTFSQRGAAECRLDGGAWRSCASPTSREVTEDGSHAFEVRDADGADSYAWELDRRAPTLQISSPSPADGGVSPDGSLQLSLEADELGLSYECALDGGEYEPCQAEVSYSGLGEGAHSFTARGADPAGNTSPPVYLSFSVEPDPPQTGIGIAPQRRSAATTAHFEFYSSARGAAYECALDGAEWSGCSEQTDLTGLEPGSHELSVRAVDSLGRRDQSPAEWRWEIESGESQPAKKLRLSLSAKPKRVGRSRIVRVRVGVSDPDASLVCRLDGEEFTRGCGGAGSYRTRVGVGRHKLQLSAERAGDQERLSYSFRVKKRHHRRGR